jgi:hypothetical protein
VWFVERDARKVQKGWPFAAEVCLSFTTHRLDLAGSQHPSGLDRPPPLLSAFNQARRVQFVGWVNRVARYVRSHADEMLDGCCLSSSIKNGNSDRSPRKIGPDTR